MWGVFEPRTQGPALRRRVFCGPVGRRPCVEERRLPPPTVHPKVQGKYAKGRHSKNYATTLNVLCLLFVFASKRSSVQKARRRALGRDKGSICGDLREDSVWVTRETVAPVQARGAGRSQPPQGP